MEAFTLRAGGTLSLQPRVLQPAAKDRLAGWSSQAFHESSAVTTAVVLTGLAANAGRRRQRWQDLSLFASPASRSQSSRGVARKVISPEIEMKPVDPVAEGEKVIGIDLGTSNSVVACMEAMQPQIIPNAEGERTTPSVVAFSKDGELLVGTTAKRQAALNPQNTFWSVKRWMGRSYEEVEQAGAHRFPYKIISADGKVKFECPQKARQLAPEEISAHVLRKLRDDAQDYLKADISRVVITVPAYFDNAQRQATKTAAKLAGLEVLRICNEPTMAALAYGLDIKNNINLLVFDLGGGTFDATYMEVGNGCVEVCAIGGDPFLGGDDFNARIVEWIAERFKAEHGIELREDPHAFQRVEEAAEKAKIELSEMEETRISVPFVVISEDGPKHIEETLSRDEFEELCKDLLARLAKAVQDMLEEHTIFTREIKEVVMVGGSTRMPAVQAVAKEVTAYKGHAKTLNFNVNPDEVVAIGAAVQAAMLTKEVRDIMLIDVTPLTLGVETVGGVFTPVIKKGMAVPWKTTRNFTTSADAQDEIEVVVLQGQRPMAKDNKRLGVFRLTNIMPAPLGIPQLEVSFELDREGILKVSAKDLASRASQSIVIKDSLTLTDEEVEEILEEADQKFYEDEDAKFEAELRFAADFLLKHTEDNLVSESFRYPKHVQDSIRERMQAVEAHLIDDVDATDWFGLQAATDDLQFDLMKLSTMRWGKVTMINRTVGPGAWFLNQSEGGSTGGGPIVEVKEEPYDDSEAQAKVEKVIRKTKDIGEKLSKLREFLQKREAKKAKTG